MHLNVLQKKKKKKDNFKSIIEKLCTTGCFINNGEANVIALEMVKLTQTDFSL